MYIPCGNTPRRRIQSSIRWNSAQSGNTSWRMPRVIPLLQLPSSWLDTAFGIKHTSKYRQKCGSPCAFALVDTGVLSTARTPGVLIPLRFGSRTLPYRNSTVYEFAWNSASVIPPWQGGMANRRKKTDTRRRPIYEYRDTAYNFEPDGCRYSRSIKGGCRQIHQDVVKQLLRS